jgi:hypothetical protein
MVLITGVENVVNRASAGHCMSAFPNRSAFLIIPAVVASVFITLPSNKGECRNILLETDQVLILPLLLHAYPLSPGVIYREKDYFQLRYLRYAQIPRILSDNAWLA